MTFFIDSLQAHPLKARRFYGANFVAIGGTLGGLYDNLWCCQGQQSWHDDESQFSV